LPRYGSTIDFQETAMNPEIPFRHRPMCESLIEIAGQKPNERGMDPRVCIHTERRLQPITMTNWRRSRYWARLASAGNRVDGRIPQAMNRYAFVTPFAVIVADGVQCRPCVCGQI